MIGVIADDFTGATDIAGLLARSGSDIRLHAGLPSPMADTVGDAEVIALKCRTIPVDEAIADATAALDRLLARGATHIYWKYCSTFDSTERGNIGPVAEALMAQLNVHQTVYCPAFPENGRSVYRGHLFVGDQLLSDSPMRHHPLTPMTDSSILRLLTPQVKAKTGLIALPVVHSGSGEVRKAADRLGGEDVAHIVVDAVSDGDLETLGQAFADHRFLTGGSAFAAAVYGAKLQTVRGGDLLPRPPSGPAIVLSGSCSAAARQQVACFRATGARVIDVSLAALDETKAGEIRAQAVEALGQAPLLITATAEPDVLQKIQSDIGRDAAGARVERLMGDVARAARSAGATRIIVAGGETSGAVTLALGAHELRVGPEIAPGVPWCFAEDAAGPFALALKSGNFGTPDFFTDALAKLDEVTPCPS